MACNKGNCRSSLKTLRELKLEKKIIELQAEIDKLKAEAAPINAAAAVMGFGGFKPCADVSFTPKTD